MRQIVYYMNYFNINSLISLFVTKKIYVTAPECFLNVLVITK